METGWTKNPQNKKVYALWFDMLRRCYDAQQLKRSKGRTYADCTVCEGWFYLSRFYTDIQKLPGYSEWTTNGKMSIDKDLLSRGSKTYSPQTCCFIPSSVNTAEMDRRNPDILRNARLAHMTKYVLSKENETLRFESEKEACEQLGVHTCSVASCFRRGSRCKGYVISKIDKEADHV